MSLPPGSRIGPYDVVGAAGAGGMGEVYRARDPKLQRDVAIKVLPPLFARDPERLARFEREARTLAALNHPHVAQVYGVVDLPAAGSHENGSAALVMEFVDGEDLAERIARTGAIPLDEALPIALQIAEALEAAHEQGIIHRDLKPANIKVRGDGQVKVLDFGLAKALAPIDAGSGGPATDPLENSPTITSPFQLSQLGIILGTAAYMAPEQAKGKPVDKRADIWAFGCVLYEMLTGARPFSGEDITDTLAAIVRADPDWSLLSPDTPPTVRTLLRRCLEKDRRERLPDIGAARLELRDARIRDAALPAPTTAGVPRRALLPWVLAAVAGVTAIAALAGVALLRTKPAPEVRVYKALIAPPSPLSGAPALRMHLSPDGRRIAFVAPDDNGHTVLWIRPLDSFAAQALTGTVNASSPFWSPDSRWVGFMADGKLKKVDPSNGAVITICDASMAPPGTWNADDVILFTSGPNLIYRVAASGGTAVPVTKAPDGERAHHVAPFFLPDGRHFLYTSSPVGTAPTGIFIGSLDSREATRIVDVASSAMYADGYLLFLRDTTLMAQPFDAETRTLHGAPVPVAEGLMMNPPTGTGAFSVSRTGVLAYQTGASAGTQLTWIDRSGKTQATLGEPRSYRDVELSPDGRAASVTVGTGSQTEVWLFDIARNLARRLTFEKGGSACAVWTPDGRSLIYGARRGSATDLYRASATGGGNEELLFHDANDKLPLGFTPDGQTLLYRVTRRAAAGELWLLPMTGARQARAFAAGNTDQVPAQVSPDGQWLAYVADEKGRREVFVTSFPANNGKWQVSTDGGDNPRWRADGKEIFFTANDRMLAVEITSVGTRFDTGALHQLFSSRVPAAGLATRSTYAVSRDGQRFLMNTWDARTSPTPITLVVNWPQSLGK